MLVVSDVCTLSLVFRERLTIRYDDDDRVMMWIDYMRWTDNYCWARECLGCVASSTHLGRDIGD